LFAVARDADGADGENVRENVPAKHHRTPWQRPYHAKSGNLRAMPVVRRILDHSFVGRDAKPRDAPSNQMDERGLT
jgi:hypothetical protein